MVWDLVFEIRSTSDKSQTFPWYRTLNTRPFSEIHSGNIEMFTTLSIGSSGIHRVAFFAWPKDIQILHYEFAEGVSKSGNWG
jgi:hypothetical protein